MILYRHPIVAEGTPSAPPWLDGAQAITHSESQTHRLAGIGEAHQMGDRPGAAWVDVGDGWEAIRVLPDAPIQLHRRLSWARSRVVADAEGRQWQVPVILTAMGSRAVIAVMGDDWLPAYTPQQERLLAVAEAAKGALDARDTAPLDVAACCQWAAEALEAANHITVRVIQRTRCMDQHLALNVLLAMTGALDAAEMAADGDHG
jgi:hypothetical protein